MRFSNFFSISIEKEVAQRLVMELVAVLPIDLLEKQRKVISVNKITRVLEGIYLQAAQYRVAQSPGFFRQAVLANTFKWELKSRGYPESFIEVATEGLVVELAKK